ncbi:helix-turn-helix transcriptional regulator [Nesterenkonia sp. CL21]|uniref:helix-turn-helix domain-containing protein n=1 Tax=Nesterenkonia sp. CL21 TaxID=3064894 RepID=UPI0028785C32|nr:helix-turn-helix transcriptional regulator [Nesterenkonia sp. CL21]MDS2172537.1 helix-turn-helix transcriptional regulator [Nesterenkonia sp. CL21]
MPATTSASAANASHAASTDFGGWEHLSAPGIVRARAKVLSRATREMHAKLVKQRVDSGMKQRHVAEVLGVTQQRVSDIERYDAELNLETVRAYANAVGALLTISVEPDHGRSLQDSPERPWSEVKLPAASSSTLASARGAREQWSEIATLSQDSKQVDFSLMA